MRYIIQPSPGTNGNQWDVAVYTSPTAATCTFTAVTVEDYLAAGIAAGVLTAVYNAGLSGTPQFDKNQLEETADALGSVLAAREGHSTAERGLRTEITFAYLAGQKRATRSQGEHAA